MKESHGCSWPLSSLVISEVLLKGSLLKEISYTTVATSTNHRRTAVPNGTSGAIYLIAVVV